MYYKILRRVLRKNFFFHLLIPLAGGILVEAAYSLVVDRISLLDLPAHLLSGHKISLYVGIIAVYLLVIGILIKRETNIGIRQLDLNALSTRLDHAKSLFAVGTTNVALSATLFIPWLSTVRLTRISSDSPPVNRFTSRVNSLK